MNLKNKKMQDQLFFNSVNFELPSKSRKFYFSLTHFPKAIKIHKSIFPNDLLTYLPEAKNFCWTSFGKNTDNTVGIEIDFHTENQDFIKRYYHALIFYYFSHIPNVIVRINFIKENQVWIPFSVASNEEFEVFEKFSLKIQLAQLSQKPELVNSYDGTSKILRKNVSELMLNISPTAFNHVKYKNRIIKWGKIKHEENPDYNQCFPLLNFELRNALGMPWEIPPRVNRYANYTQRLSHFINNYLNKAAFKKHIPHKGNLLEVKPTQINYVSKDSNILSFDKGKSNIPHEGIKTLKPYKSSPYPNIHLFYIFHKDDFEHTKLVNNALIRNFSWFKGILDYVGLAVHTQENFSITFTDRQNPLPEIENKLQERELQEDVRYIAIYVTPYGKTEKDKKKREIYYRVKEILLKRGITSQAIDPVKVKEQGYQ